MKGFGYFKAISCPCDITKSECVKKGQFSNCKTESLQWLIDFLYK